MTTIVYNMDCLDAMKQFEDKHFDLAIVDPPYGSGLGEGGGCQGRFAKYREDNQPRNNGGGEHQILEQVRSTIRPIQTSNESAEVASTANITVKVHYQGANSKRNGQWVFPKWKEHEAKKIISWDVAPKQEYFDELFRISRNQIIWGGNYFCLPPTRCFLIWRKTNVPENFSMAMCEYAWTSFNSNAKMFSFSAVGQPHRFHPTQKPIELYEWILKNYAKEGDKILDTHVGSGSSRIACEKLGFDYVGYEIDEYYFQEQEKRFKEEIWNVPLF